MASSKPVEVRCERCNKLLFKVEKPSPWVQVTKCSRCGTLNVTTEKDLKDAFKER